jgi:hypothetical protein
MAEAVTLKGDHERRPDIVRYPNSLAVAVLALKNSRFSVGAGIRQNLPNPPLSPFSSGRCSSPAPNTAGSCPRRR